jgi:hypothetical protein
MVRTARENTIRVGLLVAGALAVLMIFLFFIGSEQKIFARKNEYRVRLDTVSGLAEGNPVRLAGVTIGVVKDINLPRDPKQKDVDIAPTRARGSRSSASSRATRTSTSLPAARVSTRWSPARSSPRSGRRTSISSSPRAKISSTTSCRFRIR